MILQEYFSSGDAGETGTALQVRKTLALPCPSPVPRAPTPRVVLPWCCTSNLAYKCKVAFLACLDDKCACLCAQELQQPGLHHLFVKRLVGRALDRHNREREMASALLSSLYSQVRSRLRCGMLLGCCLVAALVTAHQ